MNNVYCVYLCIYSSAITHLTMRLPLVMYSISAKLKPRKLYARDGGRETGNEKGKDEGVRHKFI